MNTVRRLWRLFLVTLIIGTYCWLNSLPVVGHLLPGSYVTAGCASTAGLTDLAGPTLEEFFTVAAHGAGAWLRDAADPSKPGPTYDEIQGSLDHVAHVAGAFGSAFLGGIRGAAAPKSSTDPSTFQTATDTCCGTGGTDTPGTVQASYTGTLTASQRAIVATAVTVGKQMGVPPQGWVVIVATGLQESGLANLSYGNGSSVGWLQQIDTGWGTTAQRMDVAYAAGSFYRHLLAVPGWESMTVTQAAQAVQRSAYPNAYARWEPEARTAVGATSGGLSTASCTGAAPASWDQMGNPNTVAQALAWYDAQIARNAWIPARTCEMQVRLAYGWQTGAGIANPLDHWSQLPAVSQHTTGEPPAGALVYWRTSVGHIAVSAGQTNGVTYVYSSDVPMNHFGKVPISQIDSWGPRIGWSPPVFPGHGGV